MASLTQWTWVWVTSGRWWWTGRPGVLRFMGSKRVGHDWATELNWTELEPPPRWRMVTSDWTQDSWSTALFLHHQPIKKKGHKPCSLHLKCLLFLGTSDDHAVRVSSLAPVYFISESSQQFQTKLLLLQGWMLVSGKKYLNLDQVERDFCSTRQAYTPCIAGKSYWRKRPLPQFPRSILSMKSLRGELSGEAHWLKPPNLARYHSNHLHELFYDRRSC